VKKNSIKNTIKEKNAQKNDIILSKILDVSGLMKNLVPKYENEKLEDRHRFHLRILKDGRGILNIDAKYVLYLNQTATDFIYLFIKEESTKNIIRNIRSKYNIGKKSIISDYNKILTDIMALISEKGYCPIHDLGFSFKDDSFSAMEFPLRVDLAITYNCNEHCEHCYVPENVLNKFEPILPKSGMFSIMDRLWEIGVPHIALTGGEATVREDLVDLIRYGQEKGFVMGLITNGFKLSDKNLVDSVINAGLDYVQITIESCDPKIHDDMVATEGAWEHTVAAIKNFNEKNFFWMTNTTICEKNVDTIIDTINFLGKLGGKVFAMNGIIYSGKGKRFPYAIEEKDFPPILENILDAADANHMRFIWYTPTEYCSINPVDMGLGVKKCSAANTSISIEPNGDVLPCQSYFEPVGNILKDDWDSIWNSDLFLEIRNRDFVGQKCRNCELFAQCGGGCPLYSKKKGKYFGHISSL